MRLRAFLEGLVGYQGDDQSKGDYADAESAAMKKHRQERETKSSAKKMTDPAAGGDYDPIEDFGNMSLDAMREELQDTQDQLDATESFLEDMDDDNYNEEEYNKRVNAIEKYNKKIKALKAAIVWKKRNTDSKDTDQTSRST